MANLCAGCDSCQICDSCNITCLYCQSFCEVGGQNSNNGFSFGKCLSTGQYISSDNSGFNRNDWNDAIARINSVFDEGTQQNASSSKINPTNTIYLTATEFKRVANAADYISDNESIVSGAIIYGSYFSRLEDAVANLNYKWDQCNNCNAGCDGCNSCQSCDEGCEGEYCCSCNSCEHTPASGGGV